MVDGCWRAPLSRLEVRYGTNVRQNRHLHRGDPPAVVGSTGDPPQRRDGQPALHSSLFVQRRSPGPPISSGATQSSAISPLRTRRPDRPWKSSELFVPIEDQIAQCRTDLMADPPGEVLPYRPPYDGRSASTPRRTHQRRKAYGSSGPPGFPRAVAVGVEAQSHSRPPLTLPPVVSHAPCAVPKLQRSAPCRSTTAHPAPEQKGENVSAHQGPVTVNRPTDLGSGRGPGMAQSSGAPQQPMTSTIGLCAPHPRQRRCALGAHTRGLALVSHGVWAITEGSSRLDARHQGRGRAALQARMLFVDEGDTKVSMAIVMSPVVAR